MVEKKKALIFDMDDVLIDVSESVRIATKKKFQEYYINRNFTGLIRNERWMLDPKLLIRLAKKYKLGLRSSRGRIETEFALELAKAKKYFRSMITSEDISGNLDKELAKLMKKLNAKGPNKTGNSVDDYEASIKSDMDFIGIVPPNSDKLKYKKVLRQKGAKVVLNHVNELMNVVR